MESQSQDDCNSVMDFGIWDLWDIQTCKKYEFNDSTICRNREKNILQLIEIACSLLD